MSAGALARVVVEVDPRVDPRWAELALGPAGSLFTSPQWISAVCGTYGFRPTARIAIADDRPVGGFAWVEVDDVRGRRLVSLPFSDWADPLVYDAETWSQVSRDAVEAGLPLAMRCRLDSPALRDPRLRVSGEAAWHGTPLGDPLDDIFGRLSSMARRNIRAARRRGVTVTVETGVPALRRFHQIHVVLRKNKYRLLAQPFELLEGIASAFGLDDVVTVTAWSEGEPIAASVYVCWNGVLHYKFGASLADHLVEHPNEAVHWEAIRHAKERGATTLDWGVSDLDQPGLVGYKRKWATAEGRVRSLRAVAPGATGSADAGQLLGNLTDLLTGPDVPDGVTARAGSLLYRYFC